MLGSGLFGHADRTMTPYGWSGGIGGYFGGGGLGGGLGGGGGEGGGGGGMGGEGGGGVHEVEVQMKRES